MQSKQELYADAMREIADLKRRLGQCREQCLTLEAVNQEQTKSLVWWAGERDRLKAECDRLKAVKESLEIDLQVYRDKESEDNNERNGSE